MQTKGSVPEANPFAKNPPLDPGHFEVSVLPELPLLVPILPEGGLPLLLEGEGHCVTVELANNGSQPVVDADISIQGPMKHLVKSIQTRKLLEALPLPPQHSGFVTLDIVAEVGLRVQGFTDSIAPLQCRCRTNVLGFRSLV